MLPLYAIADEHREVLPVQRRTMSAAYRRELGMSQFKKDRWIEADVLALPEGEHAYIEKKGGNFLTQSGWREGLAKALSALANSGGGHLLIGVANDGNFDGVEPTKGKTPMREWLEQVVPSCVSPVLSDFRVHEVVRDRNSLIPAGRVVLAVDVADSIHAPHQVEGSGVYYYRQGGHSVPAPHFYLEALRSRLTTPRLMPSLHSLQVGRVDRRVGGAVVDFRLKFIVRNDGGIAAYKWNVAIDTISGVEGSRELSRHRGGIPVGDTTILPSLSFLHNEWLLRVTLSAKEMTVDDVERALRAVFSSDASIAYRAVSEVSRGDVCHTRFADVLDFSQLAVAVCGPPA